MRGFFQSFHWLAAICVVSLVPNIGQAKTWGEVTSGSCESLAKEAVFKGLKNVGGQIISPVDTFVIDPIVEFVTTPTEDRAKAVVLKLVEGGFKLAVGPEGLVIDGGRLVIGGTSYTVGQVIDSAHMEQVQAQVDGAVSFNSPYSQISFWDYSGLVNANPRITRDNIGETVKSDQQLYDLWYNRYGRSLQDLFSGDPGVKQMLDEAWPVLKDFWAQKRSQIMIAKLQRALLEEARKVSAAAASCSKNQSGAPTGGRFEMVNVDDEVAQTVPEWIKTLDNGKITIVAPFGHAECTWTPPPRSVDLSGFDLNMQVSVYANPKTNFATNIQVATGFDATSPDGRFSADAYAENGSQNTSSVSMHLKPKTFDFLKDGDPVYLTIGGCNAGNLTYIYAFKK